MILDQGELNGLDCQHTLQCVNIHLIKSIEIVFNQINAHGKVIVKRLKWFLFD